MATVNIIPNTTNLGTVTGSPGTLPTGTAAWTTILSGATQTIVGYGTDSTTQLPYIDLKFVSSTNTGELDIFCGPNASNIIPFPASTAYYLSIWVALVGGSLANISYIGLNCNEFTTTSGSSYLRTDSITSFTPTATLTQYGGTVTSYSTCAYVSPYIPIDFTSTSAPVNVTLRLAGWQMQTGSVFTSFIPTPLQFPFIAKSRRGPLLRR